MTLVIVCVSVANWPLNLSTYRVLNNYLMYHHNHAMITVPINGNFLSSLTLKPVEFFTIRSGQILCVHYVRKRMDIDISTFLKSIQKSTSINLYIFANTFSLRIH